MRRAFPKVMIASAFCALLAGCEGGGTLNFQEFFQPAESDEPVTRAGGAVETVERDIESPEVFSATEPGLWDGRPSLGGVWVAHPDVTEPERVIIRNTSNDRFVVGALFRRERDIPGPRLQISSDAAEALGVLAGAPAPLSVVALRKEIVAVDEDVPEAEIAAPAEIETASLDPIESAAAVLADDATPVAAPSPAAAAPAPARPPAPTASSLSKPFIQIGIFSVKANADRSADIMRTAGLVPTIKPGERDGKPFWRVVVGPARDAGERNVLLGKIKDVGFTDAYAVTN